jgi:hypothetical protein
MTLAGSVDNRRWITGIAFSRAAGGQFAFLPDLCLLAWQHAHGAIILTLLGYKTPRLLGDNFS